MRPATAEVFGALAATWPAAETNRHGPWLLPKGNGGGQRVSAASLHAEPSTADLSADGLDQVEAALRRLGQPPLFMIRSGDDRADQALAARSYRRHDPVVIYAGPVGLLAVPAPEALQAIALWPPLEIVRTIWAEGGIGPARLAVMDRAEGAKTAILGRAGNRTGGVCFVAVHHAVAMAHALEVRPPLRRQGVAVKIIRKAAIWAQAQGAQWLSVAVTEANLPARHLYASLGMAIVEHYHYRQK